MSCNRLLGPLSRRKLLGGALGASVTAGVASLVPGRANALGPASRFDVAELVIPGASLSRPRAWERLLFELEQSTSVAVEPRSVTLAPDDLELFAHPFATLILDRPLPRLPDAQREALVRFLTYGGFLFVDDTTGNPDGAVMASVRQLAAQLFPTRPLAPLPRDHSIERSFFLLAEPVGRLDVMDHLDGITVGPVTPFVTCSNDLSGALDRSPNGANLNPCLPGGEWQRREALKLAINLVLYALTSNYKHDAAHVLELMRDGRLE